MKLDLELARHNQQQRDYFEQTPKPRMVPRDTRYIRRQVREMIRAARLAPGERILEVGCGMGRYTLPLLEQGFDIEGLDLSPVLLERLAALDSGRRIRLYCVEIESCPAELEAQYDAVIGFFTLHHLHDLRPAFAAMRRLLKPRGRIAFLEPNAYNPLYYIQMMITPGMTWAGDRGIVNMRRGLVLGAMRGADLENLALERFGFFPPFVANRAGMAGLERLLERMPLWRFALPFQIFSGTR